MTEESKVYIAAYITDLDTYHVIGVYESFRLAQIACETTCESETLIDTYILNTNINIKRDYLQ